jgi:integrase/recombinase XerD
VIEGRVLEGFPLLVGDDGYPLQPVQDFLMHALLDSGEVQSILTWEAYGRRLYDFFAFLSANGMKWDAPRGPVGLSVVSRYRDWSAGELQLSASTINARLRLVVQFYEWAKTRAYIDHLPFDRRDKRIAGEVQGFLAHVQRDNQTVSKPSIMMRESRQVIRFITKAQAAVCREHIADASYHLLFELMFRVGLRSVEARSFPLKYVFNPAGRKDLIPGQLLRVELDPRDMRIKRNKLRSVDIPWSLMEDMYAYSVLERNVRRGLDSSASVDEQSQQPCALILSRLGQELARSSVVTFFSDLSKKIGFKVTAHMLRHSYGTYTLAALKRSSAFNGEPLLYVRDRMGHTSAQTTAIYLHLINQLEAQLVLQHEDEVDALFKAQSS